MMGTTHQHLGVAAAVGVSAASHLPLSAALVVCASAARWASTPDSSEKRFGVPHRTVTHWLSSCVAMAVLPVAVVVLVLVVVGGVLQYGWHPVSFPGYIERVPVVLEHVQATAGGHAWRGSAAEFVAGVALVVGALVALGRVVSMCMHTLADACTISGAPLWGPFDRGTVQVIDRETRRPVIDPKTGQPKLVVDRATGEPKRTSRRRHLVPYWLYVRTGSVDDTSVGYVALGAAALLVYLQARGLAVPHELQAHS